MFSLGFVAMSWEPSWQDLDAVDALEERDKEERRKTDGNLDEEGYKLLSIRERLYRSFAMLIFAVVFPFVFVGLGIYRGISLLGGVFDAHKER